VRARALLSLLHLTRTKPLKISYFLKEEKILLQNGMLNFAFKTSQSSGTALEISNYADGKPTFMKLKFCV